MAKAAHKAALIGSVLSAGLASACCIGPVLLALLGISGAGLLLNLEAYRPYFIGFALLLLGVAFYLSYRKPAVENCGPGGACVVPRSAKTTRILLWMATLIVGLLIFFPDLASRLL
jgi:mercuric ion transport protein